MSLIWTVVLSLGSSGCGAVIAPLFGAGAETASSTGVTYTLDNIAYRTFVLPSQPVEQETLATLDMMGFPVSWTQETAEGLTIHAKGGSPTHDMSIEIELQRLSVKTTRMRVTIKRGLWARDSATATEIILQTGKRLEGRTTGKTTPES
ncbi:MAG: hypothetical protein HZB35_09455 [Nitrospirae bacterium]|nr:hypothetical protein [Nitrospirota bacterium]